MIISEDHQAADDDAFLTTFLPGSSPAVVGLRKTIALLNVRRNRELVPMVLVTGETGAGKNHLARVATAHRAWLALRGTGSDPGLDAGLGAYDGRFHEVHLPGLPDHLIESELFGHKRGAFTDAKEERTGLLVEDIADGILLDEIGDISAALQTKLLGVLEHRRCRPVGASLDDDRPVNARLFMATNRSLEQLVSDGKFREDLYQRARLFVLHAPALREQPDDISTIARRIEEDIRSRLNKNYPGLDRPKDRLASDKRKENPAAKDTGEPGNRKLELSANDLAWARSHSWPGNIRELKFAITRWFVYYGKHSLQKVVQDLGTRNLIVARPNSDPARQLSQLVTARLDAARAEGKPAAGTLSNFLREFERDLKAAITDWYRTAQPSADELAKLFPDHQGVESIRNQLSRWRAR